MAYIQPTTKTSGDPTLAADWNTYVKDNFVALRALLPDPGFSNLPLVSVNPGVNGTAAFGQVGTAGITDLAITSAKLATGSGAAVTADTIRDLAVTTAKLATGSGAQAVTTETIRDLAVTAAKVQTGAITTAKLAANAVNRDALAAVVQPLIGAVVAYAATGAPTGWLVCNGQAVNKIAYQALFDVIGITFGGTASGTTFNVPDLRDRFIQGSGSTYALNATGGDGTHSHSVSISASDTSTTPSSTSTIPGGSGSSYTVAGSGHRHDVSLSSTVTSSSVNSLPPYRALNYLIYAGV